MHMNQLDTLYQSYGSKIDLGSFGGHRGQKVIFMKNVHVT